MRIAIENGRVIDPAAALDQLTDVFVADGRIAAVGRMPDGFVADRRLDAGDCIVCPGLIELAARLREPGAEHKATIASETHAAARAGITTLCCLPDTEPVVDTPAVVELIHHRAQQSGAARVVCLGALTRNLDGEALSEMFALKAIGCVGVTNANRAVANSQVMRRALEYAASAQLTVFLHAQDPWLAAGGCAHEGPISTRLGLAGVPETAETVAISRELLLIEQTGARAHFCRVSSARGLQLIADARARGLPVTCDVSIQHLCFTQEDLQGFDAHFHLRPPLRTRADRDALREGLADGVIDILCADHQPHDQDAKQAPFGATEPGISSLETLVPVALQLVREGVLALPRLIDAMTRQPAQVLGLQRGSLAAGSMADICVLDPQCDWTADAGNWLSAGRNSPFLGRALRGRARHTLLSGQLYSSP